MKICHNCGASNTDAAKFCVECGVALTTERATSPNRSQLDRTGIQPTVIPPKIKSQLDREELTANSSTSDKTTKVSDPKAIAIVRGRLEKLKAKRQADIMFVLDCTESMGGEIEAIKDSIIDFTDSIESEGVRARVGLVEFRDRLYGEQQRVLTFNGEVFTNNTKAFRREVAKLKAVGGGDWPESSLDAIMLALQQPFTTTGNKTIVLVTDAPPHIPDRDTQTIEEVIATIRDRQIDRIYLVMRTQDPESQVYLKLLEATRGLAFELGKGNDFRERAEDFKRTLMALGKTISQATR